MYTLEKAGKMGRSRGSLKVFEVGQGVIHKKVGPVLKHSTEGRENYPKVEAQIPKLKARRSHLTKFCSQEFLRL